MAFRKQATVGVRRSLNGTLTEYGLEPSESDPRLCVKHDRSGSLVVVLYVSGATATGNSGQAPKRFVSYTKKAY